MCTDLELDDIAEGTAKIVKPDGFRAEISAARALDIEGMENMMLIDSRNEVHRVKRVMAFIFPESSVRIAFVIVFFSSVTLKMRMRALSL
jgi:hypothetical protein